MELTVFKLTPLGLFHTVLSLVTVVLGFVALFRDRQITPKTRIGLAYLIGLWITTLTGFPIFRHGGITPPHILGVFTVAALAAAFLADRFSLFGRLSRYISAVSYSFTVLLLNIPTVTETLTRIPIGRPLAASPEAPMVAGLNAVLFVIFIVGATLQVRRMRSLSGLSAPAASPALDRTR